MRVVRQLLTESVLLAALGAALGVLVAIWGVRFFPRCFLRMAQTCGTFHAELNWHVAGFTAALSWSRASLFGLVPALQSTKLDLVTALKETQWQETRPRPAMVSRERRFERSILARLRSISLSRFWWRGKSRFHF